MDILKGKRIVIGITGSIAAYKIPYLIRMFIREGAEVRIIMTPA
ncbi:MAG: flavoprotein, partial [Bacteroidota bacterium]|nr:flavoprotein [Bacteroidota bacterium]